MSAFEETDRGWAGRKRVRRRRSDFRWFAGLRWHVWAVLFAMGACLIVIELRDHFRMWGAHGSGQSIFTDAELIREAVLFGVLFPFFAGLALSYTEQTISDRDKMAGELAARRALVREIQSVTDWEHLTELIVRLPGALLSASRAVLLAQRSSEESFHVAALRNWDNDPFHSMRTPVLAARCEQCISAASGKETRLITCPSAEAVNGQPGLTRHCLQLIASGNQKGLLVFDLHDSRSVDARSLDLLADLGGELALAIENSGLRYLEEGQSSAAQRERLRIARDLHDTFGQNISYLRLKLDHMSMTQESSGAAQVMQEIVKMRDVADEAYRQVRDMLAELRSTDNRPFAEILEDYAVHVARRANLTVQVDVSGSVVVLPPHTKRQLLFIAREALNNIEKHAHARRVIIRLEWIAGEKLVMRIGDDGVGLSLDDLETRNGYGMLIMKERAEALNSDMFVSSSPEQGTELRFHVPLPGRSAHESAGSDRG